MLTVTDRPTTLNINLFPGRLSIFDLALPPGVAAEDIQSVGARLSYIGLDDDPLADPKQPTIIVVPDSFPPRLRLQFAAGATSGLRGIFNLTISINTIPDIFGTVNISRTSTLNAVLDGDPIEIQLDATPFALAAAGYAQSAREDRLAAQDALGSALDAQADGETAALTATTKAGEAAGSATAAQTARIGAETAQATATTKAGEAATSATAAQTARTGAETAQATATTKAGEAAGSATAAQTARTGAETAQATATTKAGEAAGSATAAQTARTGAETAATTATTQAGIALSVTKTYDSTGRTIFPFLVDLANNILAYVQSNGTLRAQFDYTDSPIKPTDLATSLSALIPKGFDATGWSWLPLLVDAANNILMSANADGTISLRLVAGSVLETMLSTAVQGKLNSPTPVAGSVLESMLAAAVQTKLNNPTLGAKSVTVPALADDVTAQLPKTYDSLGRVIFPVLVDLANNILAYIQSNGTLRAQFDYTDSPIKQTDLVSGLSALIPKGFDATNWPWLPLLVDAANNILIKANNDGTIDLRLVAGSVAETMLSAPVQTKLNTLALPAAFTRLNAANAYDVAIDDDDYLHGITASIGLKTDVATGYTFTRFPAGIGRGIRGINNSGTTLQFRQSYNLPIRGRRYRGAYNPNSAGLILTAYKGTYGNSYTGFYPSFPIGASGDFYIVNMTMGTTMTINGIAGVKNGDAIVQKPDGSYGLQPGPGDGTFIEGDFWNVTGAGKYADLTLATGNRLVFNGLRSASGPKHVRFTLNRPGEFFVMGQVNSIMFSPVVTEQTGDLYIYTGMFTAQGITGVEGDYLVYEGGWGLIPGNVKEFTSGAYVILDTDNLNKWEVRRKDRSATPVSVSLNTYRSTVRRRSNDNWQLWSDSMFPAGGMGTGICNYLIAQGRLATINGFGGATSLEILSEVRKAIITDGDPHAGKTQVFYHGQNNWTDFLQMINAASQFPATAGVHQKKCIFWSVLGQMNATFSNGRIVIAAHEDAFAGTNTLAQLEAWYELMYPKQWYSPRKAMLAAAATNTRPHLLFPGMTNAQVAATYGIPPLENWLDHNLLPTQGLGLTSVGYYSTAGLPSGGSANQYYIRTAGGTMISSLLVNVAGTWTEFTFDPIHVNTVGAGVLITDFTTNFILANNL